MCRQVGGGAQGGGEEAGGADAGGEEDEAGEEAGTGTLVSTEQCSLLEDIFGESVGDVGDDDQAWQIIESSMTRYLHFIDIIVWTVVQYWGEQPSR